MKNRIIFWENEGLSEKLFYEVIDTDLFDVVGKLQLGFEGSSSPEIFTLDALKAREDEWDYLVFAYPEGELLTHLLNILKVLNIDSERLINLFYITSMDDSMLLLLSKMLRPGNKLYDRAVYTNLRHLGNYVSVSAENLSFAANSSDTMIPQKMFETKEVWASDDMIRLGKLLESYYSINKDSTGHFFDIGANIGTTSIYMKKKILPNFNIYSFEPMKENFKMLNINFLMNDVSDYSTHNFALSSTSTEYNMRKVLENWGMCAITEETGDDVEKVVSIRLDDFLKESKINPEDNLVLWVDTEGFEIDVLLGAEEVIKKKPALFLEYNLSSYGDRVDELLILLENNYSGFICFADEEDIVRNDFSILKNVTQQTDIFLIP